MLGAVPGSARLRKWSGCEQKCEHAAQVAVRTVRHDRVVSVDTQAARSSASPTVANVGVIDGTAQANTVSNAQAARRSDPWERRGWLRFLDPVLADEIRWAGALSCEELIDLAARPLDGRASRETIQEWWEYAWRRGWLVAHEADRFQLTDLARTEIQARRESLWQPNPFDWAKALAKWTLPAGAIGLAGYWTGKEGVVALPFSDYALPSSWGSSSLGR